MPIKSKLAVPIPTTSIPTFVFKSPTASLPETQLIINAENPDTQYLTLSTYRSLSQRFAAGLKNAGFQIGDRVLLASPNLVYVAIVYMGTIMAGGIVVGAQATYDIHDFTNQIYQTEPRFVLVAQEFAASITEAACCAKLRKEALYHFDATLGSRTQRNGLAHWAELLADENAGHDFVWEDLDSEEAASRTASPVYSSGTSGNPKGVELTHRQIIASIVQHPFFIASNTDASMVTRTAPLLLCHMPLVGVIGQAMGCIGFASLNLPLIVPLRADFMSIVDTIAKFGLSAVAIDPTFLIALLKEPTFRSRLSEIASLRALTLIGSPAGDEQICNLRDLWKKNLGTELWIRSTYGMTELVGGIMTWTRNGHAIAPAADILNANIELKIMDLDGLAELPDGEHGELWIWGPNLAKGYWRNANATKDAITEDRWLRTGDLACITQNKALSVVGRIKDAIKTRAGTIVPLHIEEALLTHPDIKDAVVCGVPETTQASAGLEWGTFQQIRAYVVKEQTLDLTEDDVLTYFDEKAPGMEPITGGVKFVSRIPLNTNHKPMRRVLLQQDGDLEIS